VAVYPIAFYSSMHTAVAAVATVLAVLIVGERLTTLGWSGLTIIAMVLVVLAAAPTKTDQREHPQQQRQTLSSCTPGQQGLRWSEWRS
jgi:DME family drug/metabolite transporter